MAKNCIDILGGRFTAHLLYRRSAEARKVIDQIDLVRHLSTGLEVASGHLDYSGVDIVVHNGRAIDEIGGILGYAPDPHNMYITLDSQHPKLLESIPIWVPSTVAHEMHHNKRWSTVGYGQTLLEKIVSEGLASYFEHEMNPELNIPWSRAFKSIEEATEVWTLAKTKLDTKDISHGEWFFGEGKVPRWAGYTLGYNIVESYIKEHTGKTAALLVSTPARMILMESGYK